MSGPRFGPLWYDNPRGGLVDVYLHKFNSADDAARITVRVRGDVPAGWPWAFQLGVAATFMWTDTASVFFHHLARWLELELRRAGELSPALVPLLKTMDESDIRTTTLGWDWKIADPYEGAPL